jgi:hypothetical protein
MIHIQQYQVSILAVSIVNSPAAPVLLVALVLVAAAVAGAWLALALLPALLAIPAGEAEHEARVCRGPMHHHHHHVIIITIVHHHHHHNCYHHCCLHAADNATACFSTQNPTSAEQVLQGQLCADKQAAPTSSSLQGCCRSSPCWGSCSRCRTLVHLGSCCRQAGRRSSRSCMSYQVSNAELIMHGQAGINN